MRILFFTESLIAGGKERRLLELLQYLHNQPDYSVALVITESFIDYEYVHELGIPVIIIKRKGLKYDPLPFFRFYSYCRIFKPDIIHAWGRMTTFYSIPSKLFQRIPLITSMIAGAVKGYKTFSIKNLFFIADVFYSDIVLSNSQAGLAAYKVAAPKSRVIMNGVRLERFRQKFNTKVLREELGIKTDLMLLMVAAFSPQKDYDLFLDVAKEVGKIRDDVTFVGVGDGPKWNRIRKRIIDEQIKNVILTGKQKNVERIIAASDVGILCTYSEGISNSIIESMALGKPVISTDISGGSKELIIEGETGYCVERNITKIVALIEFLLNNSEIRVSMGEKGKQRIESHFSVERMGEEFKLLYNEVLAKRKTESKQNLKVVRT
jgi:glycosyltransferase involved in cell wall biosynthesis